MKFFGQWALLDPKDWTLASTQNWDNAPQKPDPVGDVGPAGDHIGDSQLDNVRGWIFCLNLQGVNLMNWDHYALNQTTLDVGQGPEEAIEVAVWRDDPILYPLGSKREAHVWTFLHPAFDPIVGQVNTRQTRIVYADPIPFAVWNVRLPITGTTLEVWNNFVIPPLAKTKHGIWLSKSAIDKHLVVRTPHTWRDWTV